MQLWRVLHSVVVARERPDLEAQVLEAQRIAESTFSAWAEPQLRCAAEVFGKGQMLAVAEEASCGA